MKFRHGSEYQTAHSTFLLTGLVFSWLTKLSWKSDNLVSKHVFAVRRCVKNRPIENVLYKGPFFFSMSFQLLWRFCSKLWLLVTSHTQRFNRRKHKFVHDSHHGKIALCTWGCKTADERGLDIKSLVYLAVRWKMTTGQLDEMTYKPPSQSQIFI